MSRRLGDFATVMLAGSFVAYMWWATSELDSVEDARAALRRSTVHQSGDVGSVSNEGIGIGSPVAPITLVMFTDYQCPFCRRFAKVTMPRLHRDYVGPGKVRLLIRELPLSIHTGARRLADASECAAGLTRRIYEFQQQLYGDGKSDVESRISHAAGVVGVNEKELSRCMQSPGSAMGVRRDSAAAAHLGVRGTPGFVLGATSDTISGAIIRGALSCASFASVIDSVLMSVRAARPGHPIRSGN